MATDLDLPGIRARDAEFDDDDDVRAVVSVTREICADAVTDRRALLQLVDQLAEALRKPCETIERWQTNGETTWENEGDVLDGSRIWLKEFRAALALVDGARREEKP